MRLKHLVLLVLLCIASSAATAQDIITKTDGSTVAALVSEITTDVIKYHRHDNPSGPVYTVPITSVRSIRYQNGTVENFNSAPAARDITPSQQPAQELGVLQNQQIQYSDNQLIGMSYGKRLKQPLDYYEKAQRQRKIGLIGGVTLAVVGVTVGIIGAESDRYGDGWSTDFPIYTCVGVGAGLIWWGSFYLASNQQMKKAREAELYSSSLIEFEPVTIGDKSLVAGLNIMNDRMTRSHGIGLGLKFNF